MTTEELYWYNKGFNDALAKMVDADLVKQTLYIYNNFSDGKSWITPHKLNKAHENPTYCQYMGSIEVTK